MSIHLPRGPFFVFVWKDSDQPIIADKIFTIPLFTSYRQTAFKVSLAVNWVGMTTANRATAPPCCPPPHCTRGIFNWPGRFEAAENEKHLVIHKWQTDRSADKRPSLSWKTCKCPTVKCVVSLCFCVDQPLHVLLRARTHTHTHSGYSCKYEIVGT